MYKFRVIIQYNDTILWLQHASEYCVVWGSDLREALGFVSVQDLIFYCEANGIKECWIVYDADHHVGHHDFL